MVPGARALAFAARWFDASTVSNVFEPLIADWQRELAGTSGITRGCVIGSGLWALGATTAVCLATGGSVMPRTAMLKGLLVLTVSTLLLIAIQIALNATALRNDFPFEMRFWMALPMVLPLAIPLAMLPMLMLLRGSGRVSTRGAVIVVCTAALAAYLSTGWLAPLAQGDVRDALYEQMYNRDVANDQAGRITSYPTAAARQARPTTPQQRAAQRERWRTNPLYLEDQAERTRPRWGRATMLIAVLAVAMGTFGWALGSLRPPSALHAAAWWALAWITLMVLDGRVLYPGSGAWQYIGRAPYWMPVAVFATAALTVSMVCRRRRA